MELLDTTLLVVWILAVGLTLTVPWRTGMRLEDALSPATRWLKILMNVVVVAMLASALLRWFTPWQVPGTLSGTPLLAYILPNAIYWHLYPRPAAEPRLE